MGIFDGITGAGGVKRAARDAANLSRTQINATDTRNTALLAPGVNTFNSANGSINALLGLGGDPSAAQGAYQTWRDNTGYQFGMDEGVNAVQQSAAARGGLNSGATLKALNRFGTDYANSNFNTYLSQLMGQQNVGYGAVGQQNSNNNALLNMNMGVTNRAADQFSQASQMNANFGQDLAGLFLGNRFGGSGGGGGVPPVSSYTAAFDPLAGLYGI